MTSQPMTFADDEAVRDLRLQLRRMIDEHLPALPA